MDNNKNLNIKDSLDPDRQDKKTEIRGKVLSADDCEYAFAKKSLD